MTWTLEYNGSLGIIELNLQGNLTGPEIHEATSEIIAQQKIRETLEILADASAVLTPPPIVDIYELPAKQYSAEGLNRRSRIALVDPASLLSKEAAHFYVTTCVNMGWQVKSFTNRDKAVAWLTSADIVVTNNATQES